MKDFFFSADINGLLLCLAVTEISKIFLNTVSISNTIGWKHLHTRKQIKTIMSNTRGCNHDLPWPSSLKTNSLFSFSFSFLPLLLFLPPFPVNQKDIITHVHIYPLSLKWQMYAHSKSYFFSEQWHGPYQSTSHTCSRFYLTQHSLEIKHTDKANDPTL